MNSYRYLNTDISPDALKKYDPSELPVLCAEIRDFLVGHVTQSGGHLASNLGMVELTVAMHRVFDSPKDHFIFDVGHQSYVHKLLTGRMADFDTLRQNGGLSGFTKRSESVHDPFGAGHASTSLSAAIGMADADAMNGSDARQENALKNRTISDGDTRWLRRLRTHAYALPAQTPLISPIASGNAFAPANPGLAISTTPMKATTSGRSCRFCTRSPRNIQAKSTVKNGAVLLSVCPSAIVMWPSA